MKFSAMQLKEIAFMGGNVVINADDYTVLQIKEIIFAGKTKGSSVVIKKARALTVLQCKELAFVNPNHVTFDFT